MRARIIAKLVNAGHTDLAEQLIAQGPPEDLGDAEVAAKIIEFFMKNPEPVDEGEGSVHQLAEELGIDKHAFEEHIYRLLGSFVNSLGRHNDVADSEFDADQLAMGVEVESKEHTDDKALAKMIAKDHLAEISDYYTRLAKMEEDAGVED
jgi:hypothetical protein